MNHCRALPVGLAAFYFIIQGGKTMKDTKTWKITVQGKHGEEQTLHKSL
jgi:hypothetical protein